MMNNLWWLVLVLSILVIYTSFYIFKLINIIKNKDFLLQDMAKEITYLRECMYEKERVQESEEVWNNIF